MLELPYFNQLGRTVETRIENETHQRTGVEVLLADGDFIFGRDYREIIQKLASKDYSTPISLGDYKTGMARRAYQYFGLTMDYLTDKQFIEELLRVGFIDSITII